MLTARRAAELNYPTVAELVAAGERGSPHATRASIALGAVVAATLAEMEASETEGAQARSSSSSYCY